MPGIFALLGVAFVILKLCHLIAWSWWLVLLPFYGGLVIFGTIAIVALLLAAWAKS